MLLHRDIDPKAAFEQACAILEGASVPCNTPEVRKMVTILLAPEAADMAATRSGLSVEFTAGRKAFEYLPGLSAPALLAICRGRFESPPARFCLRAEDITTIRLGTATTDRWIWLLREPARILLFARKAHAVPQPLEPEPLRRWVAADRVFAIFEHPIPCPRCETRAARFRALSDALICLVCGRSWTVSHNSLDMHFETEPSAAG